VGIYLDALVKAMEDHRNELILILAGYQAEMEMFLQANPGLRSRFPIHIDFPDYTQNELLSIAELICRGRQYQLSSEAKMVLLRTLNAPPYCKTEIFGNARAIRNLIEKGIRRQAVRLITKPHISREELMLLSASDLTEVKE
jgi:stage V sporulation protein K